MKILVVLFVVTLQHFTSYSCIFSLESLCAINVVNINIKFVCTFVQRRFRIVYFAIKKN